MKNLLVILVSSLCLTFVAAESTHNQFRSYTCMAQKDLPNSVCNLKFDGIEEDEWDALNDNGCFMEMDPKRKEVLEFCPLQCVDAETAYIETKTPSSNNKCLAFFNYNILRRRNDWFLWRAGDCMQEEIQFRIGCTFPFKKRQQEVRRKTRL